MHLPFRLHALIALLGLFYATAASAVPIINFVDDPPYIDAYTAGMHLKVTASGEDVQWVIEYGETTAYGKKSTVDTVDADTFNVISFSIDGLKPETTFHYRCKATGVTSKAVVTSADKSFKTTAAVAIADLEPVTSDRGLLVEVDGRNTLGLRTNGPTTGSQPYTYQWLHNGAKVGTAGYSSYYNLRPFKVADAGKWSYKVSNPGSSATSAEINVTAVTVTRIPAKTVPEGGSFTASIALTPANPAATYRWFTNGNPTLSGIGTVTHPTPNKLTVTNATGDAQDSYRCEITSGAATLTVDVGFAQIGLKPTVSTISDQSFRVGEDVDLSVDTANDPTSVTVTGLPAGLKYSFATGHITGKPTAASPMTTGASPVPKPSTVSIVATNPYGKSAPLTFQMTIIPLDPSIVGTFNGTFDRNSDTKHLGGKLKVVVTSTGAVSGTVTIGTAVYTIVANVDSSSGTADATIDISELKSGKNPTLDLHLNLSTLNPNGLTGSVIGPEGGATVTGQRATWTAANKFALKGSYNCLFVPNDLDSPGSIYPRGSSMGTIAITDLGVATISARLADGTTATASSTVGNIGQLPVYIPLYTGKGSVLGQLLVDETGIHAPLSWNKEATAGGRPYPTGFTPVDMVCIGGIYTKPKAANADKFLGMTPGTNGAVLTFRYADISGAQPPAVTFNLTSTYTAQIPALALGGFPANPNSATIVMNVATGTVTGTFKVTQLDSVITNKNVTRTATYFGMSVPGYNDKYTGFFTIPNMPAMGPPASNTGITANPVQTGSVELFQPTVATP